MCDWSLPVDELHDNNILILPENSNVSTMLDSEWLAIDKAQNVNNKFLGTFILLLRH